MSGGGHRNKGRNNNANNSSNSNNTTPQGRNGRAQQQQQSQQASSTRSTSPVTTLSNASSSKKSNNSSSHLSKQQQQQQQQQQQRQQQQQQHNKKSNNNNNNPPLPPTVTVAATRYGTTTAVTSPIQQSPPAQLQRSLSNQMTPNSSNMNAAATGAASATAYPGTPTAFPASPPFSPQQALPNATNNNINNNNNKPKMDILKVLAEVEGGSFQVTWRECFWIGVALCFLAMCSIAVGIAAGMTISIHYYGQEIRVLPKQKATLLDPAIALVNVMSSSNYQHQQQKSNSNNNSTTTFNPLTPSLDLGRVITTSKSGQRDMLSVVEELPPIPRDDDDDENVDANDVKHDGGDPNDSSPAIHGSLPPSSSSKHKKQEPASPPIQSLLNFSLPTVLPKLCSDGDTWGFDDWYTLQKAVQEANALSAERFMKWNEYMAKYQGVHYQQHQQQQQQQHQQQHRHDRNLPSQHHQQQPQQKTNGNNYNKDTKEEEEDDLSFWYYQDEVVFTICPGAVLKARKRAPPIFINAEHVRLECEECLLAKAGTHFNFGRHAQNVWIRGITFAPSIAGPPPPPSTGLGGVASLTFYQDGAQANFHDCIWLIHHNHPYHNPNSNKLSRRQQQQQNYYSSWFTPSPAVDHSQPEPLWGSVADVNSSSTLNFYRCRIAVDDSSASSYFHRPRQSSRTTTTTTYYPLAYHHNHHQNHNRQ